MSAVRFRDDEVIRCVLMVTVQNVWQEAAQSLTLASDKCPMGNSCRSSRRLYLGSNPPAPAKSPVDCPLPSIRARERHRPYLACCRHSRLLGICTCTNANSTAVSCLTLKAGPRMLTEVYIEADRNFGVGARIGS